MKTELQDKNTDLTSRPSGGRFHTASKAGTMKVKNPIGLPRQILAHREEIGGTHSC